MFDNNIGEGDNGPFSLIAIEIDMKSIECNKKKVQNRQLQTRR